MPKGVYRRTSYRKTNDTNPVEKKSVVTPAEEPKKKEIFLDRKKPYGVVEGLGIKYRYEQGGLFFDQDGKQVKND